MMRDIKKQAAMIGILFPTLWPVSTIYDRAQYKSLNFKNRLPILDPFCRLIATIKAEIIRILCI